MPLGMEVDLGPSDIVLDGAELPPPEMGTAAPSFNPMSIVAKQSPISASVELLLTTTGYRLTEMYTCGVLCIKATVNG